jgi:hypothetical protein
LSHSKKNSSSIIAEPVSEFERDKRRAELLSMFQSLIAEDQTKQVILLLSRIRDDSKAAMIEEFKKFRADRKTENDKTK